MFLRIILKRIFEKCYKYKFGACGELSWEKGSRLDFPNAEMNMRFLNFLIG
jgi:hypothetical protein